jgi:hypothetical protein
MTQRTKRQKINDLRKELMQKYEYMRCANLIEFNQRIVWLSEGMLKNHIKTGGHIINMDEIKLYQEFKEKEKNIKNGVEE